MLSKVEDIFAARILVAFSETVQKRQVLFEDQYDSLNGSL